VSLINDALNRARSEAAQREALERGEAVPPLDLPSRPGNLMPGVLLAGVAVLAILLAVNLRMTREPQARPEAEAPVAAQAVQAAPDADAPAENGTETTTDASPALAAAPTPTAAPATTSPPLPEPPSSVPEVSAATPIAPPAESIASAPEQPLSVRESPSASPMPPAAETAFEPAQIVDPGSRHTLPDGSELHLQGIAWSASSPAAFVNGRLLSVGDRVLEFEVIEIERRFIRLADESTEIRLRLGGPSQ